MRDWEGVLPDPFTEGPGSWASIVAADDVAGLLAAPEGVPTPLDVGAEFVPIALGGRWDSTPDLVGRLRSLFRRDPAQGYDVAGSTLPAAAAVWIAGDGRQARDVAGALLAGHGITGPAGAAGLPGGTPLSAAAFVSGWALDGDCGPCFGARTARRAVLTARTDGGAPKNFLWSANDDVSVGALEARRITTSVIRGCPVDVVMADRLPIGAGGVLDAGPPAVDVWLGARRISEPVLCGAAVGIVDAALHLAVGYAADRMLYGDSVLGIPHARALLAEARADLVIADALSSVAVRMLHQAPEACAQISAAAAWLVPQLLTDATRSLSVLFGATFYGRVEPYAAFEKLLRDVGGLAVCDLGTAAALGRIAAAPWPHSSGFEVSRWDDAADAPLDFAAIARSTWNDPLTGVLSSSEVRSAFAAMLPDDVPLLDAFAAAATSIAGAEPGAAQGDVAALDAARRRTVVQAAAACVLTWYTATRDDTSQGGGAADPTWLRSALRRLDERVSGRRRALAPELVDDGVAELVQRREERRSMTLDGRPVFAGVA